MIDYSIKIGLLPNRRDSARRPPAQPGVKEKPGFLNPGIAEERGRNAVAYIKQKYGSDKIKFIDLEGINPVSVLFNEIDVDKVVEYFKKENVDAVFIINSNFGNEEVVAQVAHEVSKPVLLWGPQDDCPQPDGIRYTDSQCGLFAVSRQLQRRNIPFTYIENCKIEDEVFDKEIRSFFSVCCMVKNFKGLRVGQVGLRPKPFCSVIFNEGELLTKFDIRVIPINIAVVTDKYNTITQTRKKELEEGAALFKSRYEMDELSLPLLGKVYAFVLLYEDLFKEYNVKIISAECWSAMNLAVGAMPCSAYTILGDMGYIVGCESDMMGTLSMFLLSCASLGEKIPFFGEFTIRHPTNKNAELLWHCGPFAYSLKHPDVKAKMVNTRSWYRIKDGTYTISRMDQLDGKYSILAGSCHTTDGPYTNGTHFWGEFDNLSKWERKLIEGPYIHHMAEIEGNYTAEIKEFCKYMPQLEPDEV
jgi:L-fucose isomerase-like protein